MSKENYSDYFEETDLDKAHDAWNEDKAKSEWSKTSRPAQGEHVYRALPKRKGAKHEHFYRIVYIHYLRHPEDRDNLLLVTLCPNDGDAKEAKCDICKGARLVRKANGWDWKKTKEVGLYPDRKMFLGAVRLTNQGGVLDGDDGKPFVMDVPYDVETSLMTLLNRESPRFFGDISHPFEGINFSIERKGKGRQDTKYSFDPLNRKPLELANLEWLKDLPDLDAVETLMGVERIHHALGEHYPATGYLPPVDGGGGADDDDDEDDLVPDPDNAGAMITRGDLKKRQASA